MTEEEIRAIVRDEIKKAMDQRDRYQSVNAEQERKRHARQLESAMRELRKIPGYRDL